jgi:hypothetical protein
VWDITYQFVRCTTRSLYHYLRLPFVVSQPFF